MILSTPLKCLNPPFPSVRTNSTHSGFEKLHWEGNQFVVRKFHFGDPAHEDGDGGLKLLATLLATHFPLIFQAEELVQRDHRQIGGRFKAAM